MSKRFLSFIFIAFCCIGGCVGQIKQQPKNCNCSILVDPDFQGIINLYKSPYGKKSRSIEHNLAEEDYVVLNIKKSSDNFFYVSASFSINGHVADGWIKKSDFLGIYAKVYESNDSLVLYVLPDKNEPVNAVVKKYISKLLKVVNCEGEGWLKVQTEIDNKIYSGWLSPEMQCDNPYTTCN